MTVGVPALSGAVTAVGWLLADQGGDSVAEQAADARWAEGISSDWMSEQVGLDVPVTARSLQAAYEATSLSAPENDCPAQAGEENGSAQLPDRDDDADPDYHDPFPGEGNRDSTFPDGLTGSSVARGAQADRRTARPVGVVGAAAAPAGAEQKVRALDSTAHQAVSDTATSRHRGSSTAPAITDVVMCSHGGHRHDSGR